MARIKYIVKGKSESSTIYVRMTEGKAEATARTGFTINPKYWNGKAGEVRQVAEYSDKLNMTTNLNNLKIKLESFFNDDKAKGVSLTKEWLEFAILRFRNPEIARDNDSIIHAVREYQDRLRSKVNPQTGRTISVTHIRNYNTTIMRLEKFEAHKGKRYNLNGIDLTFVDDFVKFERNVLRLATNSIAKDIKQVKTVCLDARDRGKAVNIQILSKKFNAPTESSSFVTINRDEIENLKKYKGVDYKENARDWLIIGCLTGARVGDLMSITEKNILTTTKGRKFIRYKQSKTNKQVDVPLHKDVAEIIERRGGFPRPISDQRFNEWIKLVCKESGMTQVVHGTRQNPKTHLRETGDFEKWELVRSHTCRRSFATNHYKELPNKLIMAVTGHSTEKMLLKYIGETENDHIDNYFSLWEAQEVNDKKVVTMNKKIG
jgi:integrase